MVTMLGTPLRGAPSIVCPPAHPLRRQGSQRFQNPAAAGFSCIAAKGNEFFTDPGDDILLNIGQKSVRAGT